MGQTCFASGQQGRAELVVGRRGPGTPLGTHTARGVQGGTCFLGTDDEKLWEAVAGLFFGPNVFVPLVLTGILKRRGGRGGGRSETGRPGWTLHCYSAARAKHWGYFQACGANSALALPAEPQRGGKKNTYPWDHRKMQAGRKLRRPFSPTSCTDQGSYAIFPSPWGIKPGCSPCSLPATADPSPRRRSGSISVPAARAAASAASGWSRS